MNRQTLAPSSALPLVYFSWAHIGLATALLLLIVDPTLPAGHFFHPRMVAVVHLVTLPWISGSILGAFYVVAPLALGMPLPVRSGDWVVCAAFIVGTAGMVVHFWLGEYTTMASAGFLVLAAVAWLGVRAARGVRASIAPWPVLLHVMLAFANMMVAAVLGIAIGFDREYAILGFPPLAAAFAHAHLAAIGWPMMMVIGLAYRLVPMFLPAKMPTGASLAVSAIGVELGLIVVVVALVTGGRWLPLGALLVAIGVVAFVRNMRAAVRQKLPRPPALPRRDWSTWQTHTAIVWMIVAMGLGAWLTMASGGASNVAAAWTYGVAGLVGFISQIVVGIQGRLVPLYAWYRAMAARGGQPPPRAANDLPTPRYALPIFVLWTVGVPWLAFGLAAVHPFSVRLGALVLLVGVAVGAAYLAHLMRAARADVRMA